jgi:hypothetical protein
MPPRGGNPGNGYEATILPNICAVIRSTNFCRVHKSIRVTPAMAALITDHVWSLEELLVWR